MTIERSYKLQHRREIFSGDCHIPTGDNAVFDIIGSNLLVRSQQRGGRTYELVRLVAFQCTYHSYFCHDTARIDSQTGYETSHFVAIGNVRTEKLIGEESVEFLFLLVGEAKRMDAVFFQYIQL